MSGLGPHIIEPEYYSIDKVDFKNDRCILYLIEHKSLKSRSDRSTLNKLKRRYPDYDSFDIHIRTYLCGLGLVDTEYSEPVDNRYTKTLYITNIKGEEAIKNGRFPSEYKSETNSRIKGRYTIVFAAIACISTCYALFAEFKDNYFEPPKNIIEIVRIDTITIAKRDTVYIKAFNLDNDPVE